MIQRDELAKRYRAWQYNRKRKPWRSARFIHAAMGRRGSALRTGLCCALIAEILIICMKEPGILGESARLFDVVREGSHYPVSPDFYEDKDTYPFGKRDSGVTIDFKNGKIKFWKTDRTIHSVDGEDGAH